MFHFGTTQRSPALAVLMPPAGTGIALNGGDRGAGDR
jgi:hypothetical protein